MQIVEITSVTDRFGNLIVPTEILRESGIGARERVHLAWISDKEEPWNIYREFFVSKGGIQDILENPEPEFGEIQIPVELLEAAGIADEDEITIACADGAILISRTDAEGIAALLSEEFIKTRSIRCE